MRLFLWCVVLPILLSVGAPLTPVVGSVKTPAPNTQLSTAPRPVPQGPAPARDTSARPPGTAGIKGRVVTTNGAPLRRVQLQLAGGSLTAFNAPTVATNAQGQYEFRELPAGRYTVTAAKAGYLTLSYGQRRPLEAPRAVDVSNGQILEEIDLALPKGSVIAARVVDDLGEPVAHAWLQAEQYRYAGGKRQLTRVAGGGFAETDDLGEFRLFGLAPGEYYVDARMPYGTTAQLGASDSDRPFAPTYYPGTASLAEAQRVALGVGQEVNIIIPLVAARAARVSGTVRSADGGRLPSALLLSGEVSSQRVPVSGNGTFTATNVLPGEYTLGVSEEGMVAALGTPTPREFARVPVTVDSQNISGLIITTRRAATLRGRFVFDTGTPPAGLKSTLAIRPQVTPPISVARTSVNDNWTFEVSGAFGTGTLTIYDPQISANQTISTHGVNGWFLKAILLDGKDVTETALDFRADRPLGFFEILLTQQVTTVNGVVADTLGAPVTDYAVVLFAEEPERWASPDRFIAAGRPDQRGGFTIKGLRPGRYLAAAVDYLEVGEENDKELLARLSANAAHLTLGEAETTSVALTLVSR